MPTASRYAFSLGLVPVQEWIAEASRSRDLRAGSVLLGWLMARVLDAIREELGAEIEIPSRSGALDDLASASFAEAMGSSYGLPNRASGFCGDGSRRTAPEVFAALEAEVLEPAWAGWKGDFLANPPHRDARVYWDRLTPQVAAYGARLGEAGDCPFQVVWVTRELAEQELSQEARSQALEAIDHLYSDIKRSRRVLPWAGGAAVPKCTVCGKREALGPAASGGSLADWRRWHRENDVLAWVRQGWRVDPGERLCPICLALRMAAYARKEGEFPSTGVVAASPWLEAIRRAGGEPLRALEAFEAAVAARGRGREDDRPDLGRALFDGDRALRERGLEVVVDLRRALFEAVAAPGDPPDAAELPDAPEAPPLARRPPSYLALAAFDGDDMGRLLQADPRGVSRKIHEFARRAREVLSFPGAGAEGAAVFYLGGDEGLALLPAGEALGALLALRRAFEAVFEGRTTLSAGLVYFEQSRPLGYALQEAHRLLARAKAVERSGRRKEALGVAVQTASGTRWETVAPWGATDPPTWERLAVAVEAVRDGRLASGWAHDVEAFLESLDAATWKALASTRPGRLRAEVRRLLGRRVKASAGGDRSAKARRREAGELWQALHGDRLWTSPGSGAPPKDGEAFHLIAFLARQLAVEPLEGDDDPVDEEVLVDDDAVDEEALPDAGTFPGDGASTDGAPTEPSPREAVP